MTLTIRINMDNAAFEDLNGPEVARILREKEVLSAMTEVTP